jgi:Polyketide cyclase / dehydrase and lipid transport
MLTALIIIAIVIVAFLVIASMRPSTFSLQRSINVNASPEKIFPHLNDFKNWGAWSPWDKMDPDLKRTFSGSASGEGAKYSWIGNNKVGEGSMEITKSVLNANVELNLNFLKPFKASNVTEFKITPNGNTTNVNWEMRGPLNLFMKIMHMFMNMDKMVGKDFEKGLTNLKSIVER